MGQAPPPSLLLLLLGAAGGLLGSLTLLRPGPAEGLPAAWALLTLGVVVGVVWVAWLVLRPLRLARSEEAVGYLPEAGRSRAQVAHRVRRRRCLGELPPVFPNGWYSLLGSDQLPRGEVRPVAALGQQFAVFRGLDGEVHVVDAYCPHLGANMAVGGRVVGSCIECPFHGWQFHGEDGRCTRIPYAEKVPPFAKVKVWPSREVAGSILVWYHCDGLTPTWDVPEQEEVRSHQWVFRGITEHFVNAHIEEIPENAADIPHLTVLHGPSILDGTDLRHTNSGHGWTFFQHHWQAEWQPEPEPTAHCSRMHLDHWVTLFGLRFSSLDISVVARQVGPGLVFMNFQHRFLGRGVVVQTVTPLEPLLQHVVHRIFYQRNIPALVPKLILRTECIQFERDIMIWNNKKYVSKPVLVKEDAGIQKHRRWYAQFYSQNSVKFTDQQNSLDW